MYIEYFGPNDVWLAASTSSVADPHYTNVQIGVGGIYNADPFYIKALGINHPEIAGCTQD